MENPISLLKRVAKNVDFEVSSYIKEAYKKATGDYERKNRTPSYHGRSSYLKFETIDSQEVNMIMEGKEMDLTLSLTERKVSEDS